MALGERAVAGEPRLARRAASALYHVTSAAAFVHEGVALGSSRRLALARAVVAHRLTPVDPLDGGPPSPSEDELIQDPGDPL